MLHQYFTISEPPNRLHPVSFTSRCECIGLAYATILFRRCEFFAVFDSAFFCFVFILSWTQRIFSAHSAIKWVECEKSMRIETEQRVPITAIWHYPFISLSLLIFLFLTLFSLSLSSCQSAILCFSCVLPISSYLDM